MVRLALIRSRSLLCLSITVIIIGLLRTVDAHGGKHDYDDHNNNPNLRGIVDDLTTMNSKNSNTTSCKDGEPPFTVGQVTFKCLSDFHQSGKMCGTPAMSEEEQVKAAKDFQAWTTMKASLLDGSIGVAASVLAVDWSTVITIPTYFHVIHSGTSGKQFTYASNPSYVRNQIKALNVGYRGELSAYPPYPGRSYDRYSVSNTNTKIQFCLAGTTATDNASWYTVVPGSSAELSMKTALKKGGKETLNVYDASPGEGILGWSSFPNSGTAVKDGIVILNDSMPGGSASPYNEGDTLTHEVGHWLNLLHTFHGGCSGAGDYMNIAPSSTAAKEKVASYGCPVNLDDCTNDSGKKNPIHSFMSYVDVSLQFMTLHDEDCQQPPAQLPLLACFVCFLSSYFYYVLIYLYDR